MPKWLPMCLTRIRELAGRGRVDFTYKALRELAVMGTGLDREDACDVLSRLEEDDWHSRVRSTGTGEWLYIFKPVVAEMVVYVKLAIRRNCLLVSFHEDEGISDDEAS